MVPPWRDGRGSRGMVDLVASNAGRTLAERAQRYSNKDEGQNGLTLYLVTGNNMLSVITLGVRMCSITGKQNGGDRDKVCVCRGGTSTYIPRFTSCSPCGCCTHTSLQYSPWLPLIYETWRKAVPRTGSNGTRALSLSALTKDAFCVQQSGESLLNARPLVFIFKIKSGNSYSS